MKKTETFQKYLQNRFQSVESVSSPIILWQVARIVWITDLNIYLVSLHSKRRSTLSLNLSHRFWTQGWWRCSGLKVSVAERSRRSSPSRLSRHRPWLSGGPSDRWNRTQCQMKWIAMIEPALSPPVLYLSSQGCLDSCRGSLVRCKHLQQKRSFKIILKN